VTGKSFAFANSDSVYRQLRDIGLSRSYHCENVTLPMDVGTFEFKSGTLTLLNVVNRYETGAIFVGQGHFTLKAMIHIDKEELKRRTGSELVQEDFNEAVFRFSGSVYPLVSKILGPPVETSKEATEVLQRWRNKVRHRHEVPEGFTQEILEGSTIDNVDADVLAALYNPAHPPFFNAYMSGKPNRDLRFFVRTRVGAIQQLDSPEEVALINCDSGGMNDGIWYSQHSLAELKAHSASSEEDRRLFATTRYKIETVIGKNNHLASQATITFEPLIAGERVLKFALLPNLRVLRVSDEDGKDLHFIQEDRRQDGSFYVVGNPAQSNLPEFRTAMGLKHQPMKRLPGSVEVKRRLILQSSISTVRSGFYLPMSSKQSLVHSPNCQLQSVRNLGFGENIGKMMLHRIFAQGKFCGNFLIHTTGSNQGNNFAFSRCEFQQFLRRLPFRTSLQGVDIVH
jgi:hypothetical protein